MAANLHIKVVTPDGSAIDDEAVSFSASSELGDFCILPDHCAMMCVLKASPIVVETVGGQKTAYALDRGFLEAGADHVNVIAERCAAASDLHREDLNRELNELEAQLASVDKVTSEAEELGYALDWVRARLRVVENPSG